MTTPKPLRIFCSYSHRDEAYLNELRDWLRGLEHQGLIESWHDREITPGWEWDEAIDKNLRTADIILFLVSSAFMASDYVYENEIGKAVERHKKGEARVIPIIVRPADWQWTSFGKLQALPKDAKPITTWPNRDEAWLDVLKGVRRAVEKLLVERQERAVKERYRKEVEEAWTDNKVSAAEVERLDALASDLGLSADTAAHIERQIMGDNKEAILERQDRERQDRLDELYARARRSHQNQEWQAVVDIFAQIHAEDPTYPDSEELLASAREALEAQESGRRVAAIYAEGQRHMDAGEWQQALRCFEQVRQLRPGYRETEELLSRARQKLAPLRTVEVPDLSGQEVSQVSSTLANEGLELGARNEIWSATVPKGQIIEQRPVARTEVEAGSLVSITVSLGSQPELPALAGSSWALFLRGLVLAIFGLALLVMPTVLNVSGSGFFRLASAIVMILDWVFATIDAKTRAGRRRWLSIQGRISLGLGLLTFVTWLVAWLTTWLVPSLTDIELEFPRYLVGLWAIVIGSIRIRAAIQLSWETKYSLLMGASGGLLILFGVGAWVLPYSPFWWSPLGYLALLSGITLIALLWVWNRERSGAVE